MEALRPVRRAALVVVAVAFVASGCDSAAKQNAKTPTAPTLPRIHEVFTPLPCPHKTAQRGTTMGLEGCAEQKILKTDARIRARERRAFSLIGDTGRRAFARAEHGWLRNRSEFCHADASGYAGGSLQPVVFAECVVDVNRAHLEELASLIRANGSG